MLVWLLACLSAEPPPPPPEAPAAPPPAGLPASGAQLQDPTGFPRFHDQPAPPGPSPDAPGAWRDVARLSDALGGFRPQIAAGSDGALHAVWYSHEAAGDLLQHRWRPPGGDWSAVTPFGQSSGRNWGPDLVVRPDGAAVVVWDHTEPERSFAGQVFLSTWQGGWSAPEAISPPDGHEVGSAHVADAGPQGEDLAVVWISRALEPGARFGVRQRWRLAGRWGEAAALPPPAGVADGVEAWHSNVERLPNGDVVAGWDLGPGGGENTVSLALGRAGRFGPALDVSAGQRWGERPHVAAEINTVSEYSIDSPQALRLAGVASVWFHRVFDRPLDVTWRSPTGQVVTLSAGLGGFHFDPDVAVNAAGVRVAVWGWDAGSAAGLVYATDRGQGWSRPARVAALPDDGRVKPGLPSLVATPDGDFHVVWARWVRGQSEVWTARLPG